MKRLVYMAHTIVLIMVPFRISYNKDNIIVLETFWQENASQEDQNNTENPVPDTVSERSQRVLGVALSLGHSFLSTETASSLCHTDFDVNSIAPPPSREIRYSKTDSFRTTLYDKI